VELLCYWKLPSGISRQLSAQYGERFQLLDPPNAFTVGIVRIQQPSKETLGALANVWKPGLNVMKVYRADIAVDFFGDDDDWLGRHCIQKYGNDSNRVGSTLYSRPEEAARRFVGYGDKPSKVTGTTCYHIDLRFRGVPECRKAGLTLECLAVGIDVMPLLERIVGLKDVGMKWAKLACPRRYERWGKLGVVDLLPRTLSILQRGIGYDVTLLWDEHPEMRDRLERVKWSEIATEPVWSWCPPPDRKCIVAKPMSNSPTISIPASPIF